MTRLVLLGDVVQGTDVLSFLLGRAERRSSLHEWPAGPFMRRVIFDPMIMFFIFGNFQTFLLYEWEIDLD